MRERREFWRLSYMVRHQPRTAQVLGGELAAWADAVRRQLEALLGVIDGVAQHYAPQPDTYPLDATADCLVRQFCRPPG